MLNFVKRLEYALWPKRPRFGHLWSQVWKISVRFEIEKGYKLNFVKIRKLIPFDPKCSKFGICAQNFGKQMSDLKSTPSK